VRMFEQASELGDILVVIINNDNWLRKKKGYVFMPESERLEIIKSFKAVDTAFLSFHKENPEDMSVCTELRVLRPSIFANGGDRVQGNVPEYDLCKELNIELVFGVGGGKVQSSSELVAKFKLLNKE